LDFSLVRKESYVVSAEDFLELIQQAIDLLHGETGLGHFRVEEKLVRLDPVGEALVVGDLHGDLESLGAVLGQSGFLKKMESNRDCCVVFLGDYGDRGVQSPELYYVLLRLKLAFPAQVVLLRGNHEGPSDLLAEPHDLPKMLQRKFGDKWVAVYQLLRELFGCFYNAVYVEERYLMVHGGLSQKLHSLHEVADADKLHPQKPFLEALLWNDPDEAVRGVSPSPRGAGSLFGKGVTVAVLQRLGAKILIRGHESARDGYMINHGGMVLTLFSRKGPPYYNAFGAYLQVPLAERHESAEELVPFIDKF
jgi:diadenosine tetraphosphatase ApaH/serine/threonine PP2A family protein phosphatase